MTFPVVKMIDYKNRLAELKNSTNPMAMVVAAQLKSLEAKKADIHTKYDVKLQLFKDCFKKGYNKDQIHILIKFIDWIINLPEKYQEKLSDQLLILKEENIMPYVTSWERIARKKGRAKKNISFSSRSFAFLAAKVPCFPCVPWAAFVWDFENMNFNSLRGCPVTLPRGFRVSCFELRILLSIRVIPGQFLFPCPSVFVRGKKSREHAGDKKNIEKTIKRLNFF